MADDKRGRDDQAHNQERRQREREMKEARERGDEAAPADEGPGEELGDLDDALETHEFPTTTDELIVAYGEYEVETQDGWETLADVLSSTDPETFDSADDVRRRVQRLVDRQ